jgi:phosphoribosylformimino-5-aminoimidazole carboxamide ribotide isomerase
MPAPDFIVYPAIDLRLGQVVRLSQGDPNRQTVYGADPGQTARRWLDAGAAWLHVVDLDGAFSQAGQANRQALAAIIAACQQAPARVQLGGGLRSLEAIEAALQMGVGRVLLGTAAVEDPELAAQAIARFGPGAVGLAIDARDGRVRTRGWQGDSGIDPLDLARHAARIGVRTAIFTNIARDGLQTGADLDGARRLAEASGLHIIASGGVGSLDDVQAARRCGLAGIIIGRALYEGAFTLEAALAC